MSQPIRGEGGHLVFPISPKNTSLVEDVEILLPVKFCWILFSGFRGKVENVSANYRPGRPFCISDPPEKHKLDRGSWDLVSYQVLSNSFQGFQRASRKCLSQSEARAAILFFPDWPEKHERGRRHWELASCQVSLNSVQRFLWKVENVSANQRPGAANCFFSDRLEKHKLGRGRWDLPSCQVSLNSIPRFQRRSGKCLSQSEARAAILFFRSAR